MIGSWKSCYKVNFSIVSCVKQELDYLWEFLSGEEQRESILSTIVSSDFLDFCCIIAQKEVKDKVIETTFESGIVPENIERQHLQTKRTAKTHVKS